MNGSTSYLLALLIPQRRFNGFTGVYSNSILYELAVMPFLCFAGPDVKNNSSLFGVIFLEIKIKLHILLSYTNVTLKGLTINVITVFIYPTASHTNCSLPAGLSLKIFACCCGCALGWQDVKFVCSTIAKKPASYFFL